MKIKELRELSIDELSKKLKDSKSELFNLRCQAKLGQIEKRSSITKVKKDIARISTLLSESEKVKIKEKIKK